MAFNYPDILKAEETTFANDYVFNAYAQAELILSAYSVTNTYYRDLAWNGGNIIELVSGAPITSMSQHKQFLYYPQMIQLYVRCLESAIYP